MAPYDERDPVNPLPALYPPDALAVRCVAVSSATPGAITSETAGALGTRVAQEAADLSKSAVDAAKAAASTIGDALLTGMKVLAPVVVIGLVLYGLASRGLDRLAGR